MKADVGDGTMLGESIKHLLQVLGANDGGDRVQVGPVKEMRDAIDLEDGADLRSILHDEIETPLIIGFFADVFAKYGGKVVDDAVDQNLRLVVLAVCTRQSGQWIKETIAFGTQVLAIGGLIRTAAAECALGLAFRSQLNAVLAFRSAAIFYQSATPTESQ